MARANGARELVGITCLADQGSSRLMLSDKTLRLVPKADEADERFLSIVINAPSVRRQVDALLSGSTGQGNISQDSVAKLRIPNIPLHAQRRIVEVLDSVNERILAEERSLTKQLLLWEGVLNQLLNRHTEEHGTTRLRDVSLSGGAYGSNAPAVAHDLQQPRYIRITDINSQGFVTSDLDSAASISWDGARKYLLSEGDLLIARTGFTTGKSYLYRSSDGICAFAGYLVRFQISPETMLPEYAFLWTRGNAFHSWVQQHVREVGQRNISAREYDEHRIAVPPLEVQRKLVAAWDAARASEELTRTEIDRLRTLRTALADDLLSGRVRVSEAA